MANLNGKNDDQNDDQPWDIWDGMQKVPENP